MPEILRARPRRRLVASIVAVAVSAAACGSDATEPNEATGAATAQDSESASTVAAPADGGPADDESADGSEAGRSDEGASADDDSADDDAPVENFFPDLEVVDIADGSTLNLADELGGGDRPVLLWFWAPH